MEVTLHFTHKFGQDFDGYDLTIQGQANHVMSFLARGEKVSPNFHPIYYQRNYHNYTKDLFSYKNIRTCNQQIRKILETLKPDTLHIHGTLLPQFLYAANVARKMGIQVISTHHLGKIKQKNIYSLPKLFMHNLFPLLVDTQLAVSQYSRTSFWFRNNVEVRYPQSAKSKSPLNLDTFLSTNILNNKFQFSAPLYLCPARICHQKNQLRLVKAFLRFLSKGKEGKLLLVGKFYKKYSEKIIALINKSAFRDNFLITPSIPHGQMLTLIGRVGAVVCPSFNEGYGRVIQEALVQGKPVLGSVRTGHDEQITPQSGVLVNPYFVISIVRGLSSLNL